jgi:hypothetical protein
VLLLLQLLDPGELFIKDGISKNLPIARQSNWIQNPVLLILPPPNSFTMLCTGITNNQLFFPPEHTERENCFTEDCFFDIHAPTRILSSGPNLTSLCAKRKLSL